ncbi:bifunctional 4-hydroxy-2-oxoglutarate aldolase/2-dehydro-3-deoxy-phosphogluconate aldolase [Hyphococcus luteus]|uniref:2-dehydro-3-deoxy-phosphogluconate aldolase n=1 Tax=Hyphococcus luteus TaxID=2058213 RepID=A0A2S7K3C5_9PROT|nr:bifunctional 4-hydroxy-2-oxoglutarate aldolase/2-dehydro-3-deoxy-phosphogluconate aldolase [Marinicaulis flavus]PQA86999.1 keto-deoxy-phosphogluconate aldolase [Marinicaulis flavus]
MQIEEIVDAASVIPVLEVAELENAAPLARALAAGGLRVVELTLRTDCALDALKAMQDAAPDLIVGMGTVRTGDDIEQSLAAGAAFLVSPGAGLSFLKALADSGAPSLPGVATASEAMTAAELGFKALKFFPAEPAGGIAYLKALAGPLPEIMFCPTGSISAEKAPDYLALSNVACVGGSWIATKQTIAKGDWTAIEANARRAAQMA